MFRRQFLRYGSAALAVLPQTVLSRPAALRVGVLGGGIVGASIAYHLTEGGADVILFEKKAPTAGATRNSFAWINAFTDVSHYRDFRLQSMSAYRELDEPLQLGITWGGYLAWGRGLAGTAEVSACVRQLEGTSHPMRVLRTEDVHTLSPYLNPGVVELAAFSGADGHADPVWVTLRFLDHAMSRGARIVWPCEITSLKFKGHRLSGVVTNRGVYPLDRLIVAGGTATPAIAAMVGFKLRMQHAPGILTHSLPIQDSTKIVHGGPDGLSFKQMSNGRIVGTDANSPPNTPAHAGIRQGITEFPDSSVETMHGQRVLGKISLAFPPAAGATFDRLTLGFRPVPADGLPVIGPLPQAHDVYLAVTHSGVTLAPIIGRYVAKEILEGVAVEGLSRYRPARFNANDQQGEDPLPYVGETVEVGAAK